MMNQKPLVIKVRVKELRKQKDMTQEMLADVLGVSRQSVIALEGGKYLPSLPIAMLLAELFAMPMQEIFICDDIDLVPARNLLPAHYPPMNLKHEDGNLILEAAVPGYNKSEVDVEVEPEGVTITGGQLMNHTEGSYLAREINPTSFHRQIGLPVRVDQNQSSAKITNGMLTVVMPIVNKPNIKKRLNIIDS